MNQLQLTQEQREQVITKSLTDGNPHAPTNITEFSHKDKQFKKDEMVDQLVIHFAMDGNIISKEGDEFTDQEDYWHQKEEKQKTMINKVNSGIQEEQYQQYRLEGDDNMKEKKTSLRNTFNFQARACQTFNLPLRERGMKTDPPLCSKFSKETTQWMIFDAYMDQYTQQIEEDNAERERSKGGAKESKSSQQ